MSDKFTKMDELMNAYAAALNEVESLLVVEDEAFDALTAVKERLREATITRDQAYYAVMEETWRLINENPSLKPLAPRMRHR